MGLDFLKKIASRETKASGGGNYIKQGKGRLLLTKFVKERKEAGETVIAEFVVVSSESYPDAEGKDGKPEKANPPGSRCSYIQQLEKFKSAPGNVKSLVLKLAGDEEDEISETDLEAGILAMWSKAQPMKGAWIDYDTYQGTIKAGKNAGQPITLINWTHVPPEGGNSEKEIAARRAALEKKEAEEGTSAGE